MRERSSPTLREIPFFIVSAFRHLTLTLRVNWETQQFLNCYKDDQREFWSYLTVNEVKELVLEFIPYSATLSIAIDTPPVPTSYVVGHGRWPKARKVLRLLTALDIPYLPGAMLGNRFYNLIDAAFYKPSRDCYCFKHFPVDQHNGRIALSQQSIDLIQNLCNHNPFQITLLRLFLKQYYSTTTRTKSLFSCTALGPPVNPSLPTYSRLSLHPIVPFSNWNTSTKATRPGGGLCPP